MDEDIDPDDVETPEEEELEEDDLDDELDDDVLPADEDDEVVVAPAPGVVAFAGVVAGRGVTTIAHDDGLLTSLEPVRSSAPVGARVERGAPVAYVAPAGGHCPATCVHWGVRDAPGSYVDPWSLVRRLGPVVLVPP